MCVCGDPIALGQAVCSCSREDEEATSFPLERAGCGKLPPCHRQSQAEVSADGKHVLGCVCVCVCLCFSPPVIVEQHLGRTLTELGLTEVTQGWALVAAPDPPSLDAL